MKNRYLYLILSLLIVFVAKAQNQTGSTAISGLFNEIDRMIPNDSCTITHVDEGDFYQLDVIRLPKRPQNNTLNKVLIFVDSTLYSSCEHKIKRYVYDIYYIYGCAITMTVLKGESCVDVKNLILNDSTSLDGVVFMGNIAWASYEADDAIDYYRHKSWLCDMYFMDLDANWYDLDHDGIYDNYNDDFHPEVFVGRMYTETVVNANNELELFENYMDKNHSFWLGHRKVKKEYALSYTNPDWVILQNDLVNGIHALYGQNHYDAITSNDTEFCVADYLNRLRDEKYEFIQLASHSYFSQHIFDSLIPGSNPSVPDTLHSYINSSKIYSNGSKALGMNLFCCSACKWDSYSNLGGNYVYGPNSSVLSLVGSTKVGSMLSTPSFYEPLHSGKTMGQALVDWWKSDSYFQTSYDTTLCWFFGLTIVGDPLVNFFHCTNSTCQENITLTSYNTSLSPVSYYLASESITVSPTSGSFTIPQGDHCILNAPTVEIHGEFYCPLGSSMEIVNEGCRCNCEE